MHLPKPSTLTRCDTRSIFKWSTAGFNSESSPPPFSNGFFSIGQVTHLPYNFTSSWARTDRFIPLATVTQDMHLCFSLYWLILDTWEKSLILGGEKKNWGSVLNVYKIGIRQHN